MFIVFDCEVYQNYFLARFLPEKGNPFYIQIYDGMVTGLPWLSVMRILDQATLVTFNGWRYDMPILSMAAAGMPTEMLKQASDDIILCGTMPWQLERSYHFSLLKYDHIDVINLCPLQLGLKLYSARIGTRVLEELPVDPAAIITANQAAHLFQYCGDDCQRTWEIFIDRFPQIELRMAMSQEYGIDLRSKSDAQIAEAVMKSEYRKITGGEIPKPGRVGTVRYTPPEQIQFQTPDLKFLLSKLKEQAFEINDKGKPLTPQLLYNRTETIGLKRYKVGLGGLHSVDKGAAYHAAGPWRIIDLDVASYYPAIILNCGYAPPQMGGYFTQIYREIVEQRLIAKGQGRKVAAEALKIVINGTFGKLGSHYSVLYAPELMLSVTLTGQLSLLMLIERLDAAGIRVISANTDGVTIMVKDDFYQQVADTWQVETGFELEAVEYRSIYYRDVNNYIAIKLDGSVKTKGVFKPADLSKNPANQVCFDAAVDYLTNKTLPIDHIKDETDIRKFLTVRTVKGGAVKDGRELGKVVRWYHSFTSGSAIHYKTNGNMVPNSLGGEPMMNLTDEIPADLDYEHYRVETHKLLKSIGAK